MFGSVDFRQVRILTRFALKSEWRSASLRMRSSRKKMSRSWAYWTMVSYLGIGAFSIRLFAHNFSGDAYVTAAGFFMLYVAFISASNIFLSFGTGFLSPDESQIISMLPVGSETFFFSRLAVLITYTTTIGFLVSIGPFIGLQFFFRPDLFANLAFLVVSILTSVGAAMTVIALYGLMLRRLKPSVITRMMGYVQFLGSFVVAMSFVLLTRAEYSFDFHTFNITTEPLLALLPAFWFASLAGIVTGVTSGIYVPLAIGSIALLVLVAAASHLLLGKHYQNEISELSASASTSKKEKNASDRAAHAIGGGFLFRTYTRFARSFEARAVFMLLRAQFRYDTKFRMQLLATLPLTFVYLFIAIMSGGVGDPFTASIKQVARANLLYMIALLMPMMLMQNVSQSANYKAAWIFFSAPLDRAKLLLAVRNALLISLILPYMIVLAITFSFFMPVYHAIEHVLVLGAIAGLLFQLYIMMAPRMPFAQQRRPNRGNLAVTIGLSSLGIFAVALLGLEIYFGYRSAARYWPTFALIVTMSAVLEQAVRARVRKKLEQEEFEG